MNDAELVKKILAGDEERFGEIVDRYARNVWALCASYVHNPSDCEDLVQESFVRSYLRLNTIREPKAFGAWLSQIARTRCLEWLRKRTREKDAVANLEENAGATSAEAPPSENAERNETRAFVRRNLEALPDKYREALYLYYIGGHSVTEAAQFLDITESAMKKRLQLGREKLHDQIAGAIEEALGEEQPRADLEKTVLAAVPFGQAVWLGKGGLLAATTAAATGVSGAAAGLGWAAVVATLAAFTIGGYVYYTSQGGPVAQAGSPLSLDPSDLSDASDLSDPSDPGHSLSTSAAMLAQADPTEPENTPEPPETVSSSEGLVHWKWQRSAEPPESGKTAKALRGPVSIEFEGEYIVHILEFISEYVGANIVLDTRPVPPALGFGVSANEYRALVWERYPKSVPAYVTDGLVESVNLRDAPLSAALEHLLYPLGLVYDAKPFGIFVTTAEAAGDTVEDKDDDGLSTANQALSENVSLEFRYEHVVRILEFVSEYIKTNIVVDQRVVAPPVPPAGQPGVQVLDIKETPNGDHRALLQFGATEPHWYGEGERVEEYLLHTINPRWETVELFSEQQRHNFQFKVERQKTNAPGFPIAQPEIPPAFIPAPQVVQRWLQNLAGNQYVTDGLVDHINLRDVELRYALDALLTPLNLTYENEGDYIFVSSPELLAQDNDRAALEGEVAPGLREALADDVSIEFEGEKLVRVLEFLAESTRADIAMGSEYVEIRRPDNEPPEMVVLPKANWYVPYCNLRDVPLQAVLDALLRQHGLDFIPAGDKILVGTPEELSALDELAGDYWVSLDLEREKTR